MMIDTVNKKNSLDFFYQDSPGQNPRTFQDFSWQKTSSKTFQDCGHPALTSSEAKRCRAVGEKDVFLQNNLPRNVLQWRKYFLDRTMKK